MVDPPPTGAAAWCSCTITSHFVSEFDMGTNKAVHCCLEYAFICVYDHKLFCYAKTMVRVPVATCLVTHTTPTTSPGTFMDHPINKKSMY